MNGRYLQGRPIATQVAGIIEFNPPGSRVLINELSVPGSEVIKATLDELCRLDRGWDGYSGQPVSFSNANFALGMLGAICRAGTPVPQIVPGTAGDLQIEWHTDETDIELHVRKPNDVHAWRRLNGEAEEVVLTNDFTIVRKWIDDLTSHTSGGHETAAA